MQGATGSGLLKTTLFLTKTMFTFCILSLIIYLNFTDLQENNANRAYLNLLKSVAEKYHASELLFKDYELKRLDTLKGLVPQVYAKHNSSRIALVRTLNRYGASVTRATKGGGDKKNNVIMLMSDDSLRTLFCISRAKTRPPLFTKQRGDYSDDSRDETVSDALNIFNTYPQQEEVTLLTDIDTTRLAHICDSLLQAVTGNGNPPPGSSQPSSSVPPNGVVDNSHRYPAGEADNGSTAVPDSGHPQQPVLPGALFGSRQVFNGLCIYPDEVVILIFRCTGRRQRQCDIRPARRTG